MRAPAPPPRRRSARSPAWRAVGLLALLLAAVAATGAGCVTPACVLRAPPSRAARPLRGLDAPAPASGPCVTAPPRAGERTPPRAPAEAVDAAPAACMLGRFHRG